MEKVYSINVRSVGLILQAQIFGVIAKYTEYLRTFVFIRCIIMATIAIDRIDIRISKGKTKYDA